jgi:hypothetical protein
MAQDNKSDIIIAMLEEVKTNIKSQKQPQIDLSKVELFSAKMERNLQETKHCTNNIKDMLELAKQPIISEQRTIISIESKSVIFTFIGMIIIIAVLSSWLYFTTRPNYDRIDNDLKYRYIKMKGKATTNSILELENLFEINRDNAKIRQMLKDVEEYERAVKENFLLDEQAQLHQKKGVKVE